MADSSDGLDDVVTDLKALENQSEFGIEVVKFVKPKSDGDWLVIDVSIDCGGLPRSKKGFALRSRERFWLCFPADFPLSPPSVFAPDKRFAFHDHVYWADALGVNLCIYYSVERQWRPADGVSGFVYRFMQWLEDAAAGSLDRDAQPFHPPLVRGDRAKQFFVVRADCPEVNAAWFGYAILEAKSADRIEIVGWTDNASEHAKHTLAPTILIDTPFVSEFPEYVSSLLLFLEHCGVDKPLLVSLLLAHARFTTGRPPMFLVFGVAMRGTVGEAAKQHLIVWRIDDRGANDLRRLARRHKRMSKKSAGETIDKGAAVIDDWQKCAARLAYCTVYEDRPEIVRRRDGKSGVAWFRGKTVTLWGAGALGSPIAEHLVRAGVAEIRLVDSGRVTPGILVRQNFRDADIGKVKVTALKARLLAINPSLRVVSFPKNLLRPDEWRDESLADTEILIDATASGRVALVTDKFLQAKGPRPYPVITVANDLRAKRGLITLTPSDGALGPTDLLNRAFLKLRDAEATEWLGAFWPAVDESDWFEPEPGCSSPTFLGSNADAAALAGGMLARVGQELNASTPAPVICGRTMAVDGTQGHRFEFEMGDHRVCPGTGYEVRFFPEAAASMTAIVDSEQAGEQDPMETGGVLFGYRDDYLRVMWVVDAVPPPPDSRRSRREFVCGVEGVAEAAADWQEQSAGLVGFLGTWHSHPVSPAAPSVVDLDAMADLLRQSGSPRHRLLLVIVGYSASCPSVGSYVFGGISDGLAARDEDNLESEERR